MPQNKPLQGLGKAAPRHVPPPEGVPPYYNKPYKIRYDIRLPNPDDTDPQLTVERALMGLSQAYPEAMKVKTMSARPYMRMVNAAAGVHPFMPNTVMYNPDEVLEEPTAIMAHELEHSRQMGKMPAGQRILASLQKMMKPYDQQQEEIDAEATAQAYVSRMKGDIRLPDK